MKEVIAGLILAVLMGMFMNWVMTDHYEQIKAKVESLGGTLIDYDQRIVDHPFILTKNTFIYHFTYRLHGSNREGFVRFGITTDWRF